MPRVRFGSKTVSILLPALRTYKEELGEILTAIELSARHAELEPEGYIPRRLAEEREIVDMCFRTIEYSQHHEPFPVDAYNGVLQCMHAALLLRRDDLMAKLKVAEADPLCPPEALLPLQDRLTHMADEIERFWQPYGVSDLLPELRRRREIRLGSRYPRRIPLDVALSSMEGQELEFMEKYPTQAHDLAKEIAAFGSSNPGTIFIGVTDDGEPVGLPDAETSSARDRWQNRVEGVSSNSVVPSLVVAVSFEDHDGKTILRIKVPKGSQPLYYSSDRPYVRHGSRSRPAQSLEVIERVRAFLERQDAAKTTG